MRHAARIEKTGLAAVLFGLMLFAHTGCRKGDALVKVTVTSLVPLASIAHYDGTIVANGRPATLPSILAGQMSVPAMLDKDVGSFEFGIRVPLDDVGDFSLTLKAIGANGQTFIEQTNTTTTSAGSVADLEIIFGGPSNTDGGVDGGSDGPPPCTCEAEGIGCGMATICGMAVSCGVCLLAAVEPEVVQQNGTVRLEGRFPKSATVSFSGPDGGVPATLELLGPQRAKVTVPAGAITGPITLTGGATMNNVGLKVTSFPVGLQSAWRNSFPQSDAGRLVPQLVDDRSLHAVVALGDVVIAFGGVSNNMGGPGGTPLDTIEQAYVNADGTLQPFMQWPNMGANARKLVVPRLGHVGMHVSRFVYAIGGWDNATTVLNSVEKADINGDGSGIQTFVASDPMLTGRYLHTATVVGGYLYVIGGFTSGSVYDGTALASDTIERAPITANGLGPFEAVSGKLTTPRGGHGTVVVGNTLYVMGGLGAAGALDTMESAPINGDGSLGAFTASSMKLDQTHAAFDVFVMGGKVHLVGGVGGMSAMPDNVATVATADIMNGDVLGPFTPLPNIMSRPRAAFGRGVIVGNNYYVFGAGGGSNSKLDVEYTPINANGDIGTWTTSPKTMMAHRTAPGSIVAGRYLYVFGGQSAAALDSIERAPILPDGSLGDFVTLPNTLSTPRTGPGVFTAGNQIYVVGGGTNVLSVDVFQVSYKDGVLTGPNTGTPLTTGRQNFQLVAEPNAMAGGGWVYAIGGDGLAVGTNKSIERVALDQFGYVMGTFSAATLPMLNNTHAYASGTMVGNTLLLFGDLNSNNMTPDQINFDGNGNIINVAPATTATLTHGRWSGTMVDLGRRMLLAGGNFNAGAFDATVDSVNVGENMSGVTMLGPMFVPLMGSSLLNARRSPVSTAVGNFVYVMGGYGLTGGDLSSIELTTLK